MCVQRSPKDKRNVNYMFKKCLNLVVTETKKCGVVLVGKRNRQILKSSNNCFRYLLVN